MNQNFESKARNTIEEAYLSCEEKDVLITITERGLINAISEALRSVHDEAIERAALMCEKREAPLVIMKKPTVQELEAILKDSAVSPVELLPDGSIRVTEKLSNEIRSLKKGPNPS